MLIKELRISNLSSPKTTVQLDKANLFCGNKKQWQIICRSLGQLFGEIKSAAGELPEDNELTICADFIFPDTENECIPELFHHLKSGENDSIHCTLESILDRKKQPDFNWLLPHDVKRPVKIHELSGFDILYLSNDFDSLKYAAQKTLSRILASADKADFSIADFCTGTGLENFSPILTAAENLSVSADICARQIIEFQITEAPAHRCQNIQNLLAELLDFADKSRLLPWHTLLILDDLPPVSILFWKEHFQAYSAIQTLCFSNHPGICRDFPLPQIRRLTADSAVQLLMPDDETEKAYIAEVLDTFPELLTADTIIFTASASDRIILEKFARLSGIDFFINNIASVPLAGKSVSSLWKIAEQLKIPYVTLLDLDHQHPGGDWEQISAVLDAGTGSGKPLPAAEGSYEPVNIGILRQSPIDLPSEMIWLEWLKENWQIFISAPQDLNYLMFQTFLPEYRELFPELDQQNDESFFQQLFSTRDHALIHTRLFSSLSDEKISQRIPEFISELICRIKMSQDQLK